MITITGHSPGSGKPLFESFSTPIQAVQHKGGTTTLRTLVKHMVTVQVEAFSQRQHDNQFIRVLTTQSIQDGCAAGRISSGGSRVPSQSVNLNAAIANALQSFEDGLYLVAIDSQHIEKLDDAITLTLASRVTFIRLTPIIGG